MKNVVRLARRVVVLAVVVFGCAGVRAYADDAPLRIAVYVGEGARSGGVFRWLELMACARDGRVCSDVKGNLFKGCFHVPRMQAFCCKFLEPEGRER